MYLIAGLGNPGVEYEKTRHNMGFQVIDKLAKDKQVELKRKKFDGLYGETNIQGEKIIFLKPQTYMNLSGKSIAEFVQFYKIPLEHVLVIYDDMDILPGKIKVRKQGGAGSHNGMKSVVHELQSEVFPRIRVGIGRTKEQEEVISYVIGHVEDEEWKLLEEGIDIATKAVEEFLINGIETTMNRYN